MKLFHPFKGAIEEIKNWVSKNLELIQIKGIKKAVEISSSLTFSLLIFIFILIGFSFLSISLVLYLGQLLSSYALAFLIVGAIPILAIVIMLIFKKSIYRFLLDFFTRIFTK